MVKRLWRDGGFDGVVEMTYEVMDILCGVMDILCGVMYIFKE